MKSAARRMLSSIVLLAIVLGAAANRALAQELKEPPATQAVSQTGLLPVYGVDFNFDSSWVDGSKFPSQSAQFANSGVNNSFQQVWDGLRPSGFNIVRFQIDVRDGATAANRLVNLCVWAKQNGVKLIPVLLGADRGKFPGKDFPQNVASFIAATLTALRSGDGQSLAAYSQILAYQIEDQVNHAGLHQPFYPQNVAPLVAQVAAQIRQTEQSGLKGTEMNATPLLVNVSFDFELILKQAIAGATMTDDAYAQAYDRLKQMLLAIAATPEIDVLDVQWLAGSMGAGSPEKFAPLLRSLASDVPGKQFIFTTGFSTAFRSGEDQKNFFALTSVNLADYRASAGMDSPFLGVILREALKGKERNAAPPKPQTASEMAHWNWAAKAYEMIDTWSTKKPSADMIWWQRKVEGNLGLFTVQSDGAGSPSIAAGPGQETLQQFASAVSESSTASGSVIPGAGAGTDPVAVPTQPYIPPGATGNPPAGEPSLTGPPPGDPSFKRLAKEKAQQGMATLMDRVIERLGAKLGGAPGSIPGGPIGPGADSSRTSSALPTPPTISVSSGDVLIAPASPRAGESVAFNITLRNAGGPDATGLVVAVVDETGSLLGTETQLTDVVVAAGATQIVALNWTPGEAKTYQSSLIVLDSTLTNQLASLSLPPLVVSGAPARVPGALSTSGAIRAGGISPVVAGAIMPLGLPQVRSISVGTGGEAIKAGASSPITVSLSNPYGRPLANVTATLVVDGRPVASKPLGTLLPKQDRSILFPGIVFAHSGAQQLRVSLESRGTKTLTGHITRQVMVGAAGGPIQPVTNPHPAASASTSASQPASAGPPLRPLLPSLTAGTSAKKSSGSPSSAKSGPTTSIKSAPSPGTKPGLILSPVGPVRSSATPVKNPEPSKGGSNQIPIASPVARVPPGLGKPDLTIEWVTYPSLLPAGGTIVVKVRVKNIGTAKAAGTASARAEGYMIDIMLSRDNSVPDVEATYSPSFVEDALLGGGRISSTRDINPRESQEYGARVAIPANAPKPKIVICARVDSGNKIAELNERNNVACWSTSVR
ncbi:MAG TPA: CARDB domain-containing protein [Blastocatellia bacterium]|nr:CARDB domain-containing protein [Blastocatellia bacterium]